MDDIKTTMDRIMEQFNEGVAHPIPRRLNFPSPNTSFRSEKRKNSAGEMSSPCEKKFKEEPDSSGKANDSLDTSINAPSSPWTLRRLKADLLEANSKIFTLKNSREQEKKMYKQCVIVSNDKISNLERELEYANNKLTDMEKHLTAIRKRGMTHRDELAKANTKLTSQKDTFDEAIQKLQKTNAELEANLITTRNKQENEISDLNRKVAQFQSNYLHAQEETEKLRELYENCQSRAQKYEECKSQLDMEKQTSNMAQSRIKELEFEIESLNEMKELTKNSQARLSQYSEFEREIKRLRQDNKNLQEMIGNKLLMEEQVHDLQSRLKNYDDIITDNCNLKAKIKDIENEINDWRQIAKDHCSNVSVVNPITLRSRIEEILRKDLILANEGNSSKKEKDTIKGKLLDMERQIEVYKKANSDLSNVVKTHRSIIYRTQKKMVLVAKERDCYKQVIESYEKDLTINGPLNEQTNIMDPQLKMRVDMLEKTLTSYKEMYANLESEMQSITGDVASNVYPVANDSYEKLRKDIEMLQMDNDRLRRRKEELELEIEHRNLKGDFNVDKFKVVHMALNPAAEAYEQHTNEVEKLQAEIERLRRRIKKHEEEQEELTVRLNDTNLTLNIKEINTLRTQIKSLEDKNKHLKEMYKQRSLEFRDVCYLLFGYRVDHVGNSNYRISSMFAESPDDYLNFRLSESGVLDMLESNYSTSISDMIRTNLATHHSLPAFLATLTLELFNRTTVAM